MSKKKETQVFEDCENPGSYLISYFKNREDAWKCALKEYPEIAIKYTIDDMQLTHTNKCLDCLSSWIGDDLCGECGEPRLSRINVPTYYLHKD